MNRNVYDTTKKNVAKLLGVSDFSVAAHMSEENRRTMVHAARKKLKINCHTKVNDLSAGNPYVMLGRKVNVMRKTCKMTDQEKIQTLIEREYTFYSEELKPYIDAVEVYFGAVPDGLLNEIRKFVGHISSATIDVDDQPQTRVDNINAAHKHMRRILLDCYNLMCIYGNFDVKLHEKSRRASEAFKDAKKADSTGNNDKLGRKYFFLGLRLGD